MHRGYIKLYRRIQDNHLWTQPRVFSQAEAWIDILMEVNHTDAQVLLKGCVNPIECKAGQSLNSLDTWALRWGWTKSKTRRFFKMLDKTDMAKTENVQKTTRLTVCNYAIYAEGRHSSDTPATLQRHASDTPATPNKNGKNGKHAENEKNKPLSVAPTHDPEILLNWWNGFAPNLGLNVIRKLTDKRKNKARTRMGEGIADDLEMIQGKIEVSDFLKGSTGWRADFDFIIENDTNWQKILEGKYDNKGACATKPRTPEQTAAEKARYDEAIAAESALILAQGSK
jgi:putative sterol carrier protein